MGQTREKQLGEVFTPMELCRSMVSEIPLETIQDPQATFCDPSAGSGNFLVALKERLTQYHSEDHVLSHMIYGVELMPDNHREMCERLGISTDHPHVVCHDALTWGFWGCDGPTSGTGPLDGWF